MSGKVVSKEPFMLKHYLYRYKTKETCGEAVDACLSLLEFVPDWFCNKKNCLKILIILYFFMTI